MNAYLAELFNTITAFPGNLTYHLIVSFSIGGALYLAYQNWRASEFPQARRMVIGLSVLLVLRLAFFIASLIFFIFRLNPELYLPPIDRAVNTISIVMIIWLWGFPEPSRPADTSGAILVCLLILLSGFTLINWSSLYTTSLEGQSLIFFNEALLLNSFWSGASVFLCLVGIILLVVRRPNSWIIGMMMLVVLCLGDFVQLLYPLFGASFAGPVRLAQLAAYPMLLALPGRFSIPGSSQIDEEPQLTVERRSYGTESETFRAFTSLVTDLNPAELCLAYTKTISHVLLADICLLVVLREKEITFECGYDLIRELPFPGTAFSDQDLPLLASAFDQNKTLRLPASSTSPDLKSLSRALDTDRIGHLLAAPIPGEVGDPITGVVLLSPYSNRSWNSNDEKYLVEIAESLAKIARHNELLMDRDNEIKELSEQLATLEDELKSVNNSQAEFDYSTEPSPGFLSPAVTAASLAEVLAAREEDQQLIEQLREELHRLSTQIDQAGISASSNSNTLLFDLKQPLQSIQEYTDLLLSRTPDEPWEEQVRYLRRIRASVERLEGMVTELIGMERGDRKGGEFFQAPVNIYELIDEAIDFTQPQLRQKNIAIRVDLSDTLPELGVDRSALQQILILLLQNAGTATPANGEIALHAHSESNNHESGSVLLQVTDNGGGISSEDLPRVFSRITYADDAGIPGVGEGGAGLVLTKNLVEEQQGRIWIDTRLGEGSTFNIILPAAKSAGNGGGSRVSVA